jgi:hypothetical protein
MKHKCRPEMSGITEKTQGGLLRTAKGTKGQSNKGTKEHKPWIQTAGTVGKLAHDGAKPCQPQNNIGRRDDQNKNHCQIRV